MAFNRLAMFRMVSLEAIGFTEGNSSAILHLETPSHLRKMRESLHLLVATFTGVGKQYAVPHKMLCLKLR